MKATCPNCGRHGLVAIFVGVKQSIAIEGVDGNGLIQYGETKSTGGSLECVWCPSCVETVEDGGVPIRSLPGLAAWLAAGSEKE